MTGLMVSDRRFPGTTILGASLSTHSASHPLSVPRTGSELRDASWTVCEMAILYIQTNAISQASVFYDVAASLRPAVAAAAVQICPDVEASRSLSVEAAAIRACPDVAASLGLLPKYCLVSFLLRASGILKFLVFRVIRFLGGDPKSHFWDCVLSSA